MSSDVSLGELASTTGRRAPRGAGPSASAPEPVGRDAIDGLRGLAALAVLLVHVYQLFLLHGVELRWLRSGDVGVSVFFVLSGYLIAGSVLRPSRFDRRSFVVRRLARILPLYWVSIAVAVLLVDASPLLSDDGRWDLVAHLTMVHGFFESTRLSISGVWWTLTIECCFYLFMALAAPVVRHRWGGPASGVALITTGLAWRSWAASPDATRTSYLVQQLPGAADQFGVGLLVALVLHRPRTAAFVRRPVSRAATMLGAALVLPAALWSYHDRLPEYWRSDRFLTAWPLAVAMGVGLLLLVLTTGAGRGDVVAQRLGLAYLGRISYGVYLLHPFVLWTLFRAWWPAGSPLPFDVPVVPFTAMGIAGTMLLAAGLHRQLELPAMAWARRRAHRSGDDPRRRETRGRARFRPRHSSLPALETGRARPGVEA